MCFDDCFFTRVRRHTRCALVTGVQTCALPISGRRADLGRQCRHDAGGQTLRSRQGVPAVDLCDVVDPGLDPGIHPALVVAGEDRHYGRAEEAVRSEEHTSELQSLMRISYAVFCLKKKTKRSNITLYQP